MASTAVDASGAVAQNHNSVEQGRDGSDSDEVLGTKGKALLRATRCPSPEVTVPDENPAVVSGPWNISNAAVSSAPTPVALTCSNPQTEAGANGAVGVEEIKLIEVRNAKDDINEYARRQETMQGSDRTVRIASSLAPHDPSTFSPVSTSSEPAPSAPALSLATIRRSAIYCTPHIKIPGVLTISRDSVLFEPDTRHEHVREFGIGEYQLFLDLRDLEESAAMAMPFEDSSLGDVAFFLQLHVRTLDGHRFCSPNVDNCWCVVFRLQTRDDLHEAAMLLIDFLDICRAEPKGQVALGRSCTSIPFCSMSCLAEFEAASEARRRNTQREKLQAAAERPIQRPTPQGSPRSPSNWEANALSWSGALSMTERWASKLAGAFNADGNNSPDASRSPHRRRDNATLPIKAAAEAAQEPLVILRIPDEMEMSRTLLTRQLAEALIDYLPVCCRSIGAVEWVLKYTPKAHGTSLSTLYRNVNGTDQTVVLVRDANNHVFGGFAPACWDSHKGRFYGNGESFVFSYGELPAASLGSTSSLDAITARVYPWTARNNYFMYSDNCIIGMGGGNGRYAFAVHSDFLRGSSSPTATYGNPTLASSEEFAMRDIEVWAFQEI